MLYGQATFHVGEADDWRGSLASTQSAQSSVSASTRGAGKAASAETGDGLYTTDLRTSSTTSRPGWLGRSASGPVPAADRRGSAPSIGGAGGGGGGAAGGLAQPLLGGGRADEGRSSSFSFRRADSASSAPAGAPAAAAAAAAAAAGAAAAVGGATGRESTGRESLPDEADELAMRLVAEGGGWIQKRDRGFGAGGDRWKRRWVSVRGGTAWYAKQRPPQAGGGGAESKPLALAGLALSVGSDGRALRLGEGPDAVDWQCEGPADRSAWVAYFKAGIAAGR